MMSIETQTGGVSGTLLDLASHRMASRRRSDAAGLKPSSRYCTAVKSPTVTGLIDGIEQNRNQTEIGENDQLPYLAFFPQTCPCRESAKGQEVILLVSLTFTPLLSPMCQPVCQLQVFALLSGLWSHTYVSGTQEAPVV